jgi:spore maturation protein CgeB
MRALRTRLLTKVRLLKEFAGVKLEEFILPFFGEVQSVGYTQASRESKYHELCITSIFDEYSFACLSPEAKLLSISPDNFKEVVGRHKPQMLFVESAWRGNGSSWRHLIESRVRRILAGKLRELVTYCERNGIPTIFWNKEDPVNFTRFLPVARMFRYVFTTDRNMLPAYRKQLGHNRVFELPFAAQPKIHNPVTESERKKAVCFAGTYWADRPERYRNTDILLQAALNHNLHIYDRHHGVTGRSAYRYKFPDIYHSSIKGTLSYSDMIDAYRQFRIFLNTDSVTESPTMCSRRVFELLASGTPVVSTYSKAVEEMLNDEVRLVGSIEEADRALSELMNDDECWAAASHTGIRKVLLKHTYEDRLKKVCQEVGVRYPKSKKRLACLILLRDESSLSWLHETIACQEEKPDRIWLIGGSCVTSSWIENFSQKFERVNVSFYKMDQVLSNQEKWVSEIKNFDSDHIVWMNPNHYYGKYYLLDRRLALHFAESPVLGKASWYSHEKREFEIGPEYKVVRSVQAGSASMDIEAFSSAKFRDLCSGDRIRSVNGCLAIDRFGYSKGDSAGSFGPGRLDV